MSIRRYSIVFCDLCGDHDLDDPEEDSRSARANMAAQGWRVVYGKDICPAHEALTPKQIREEHAIAHHNKHHRQG
jgi:hypothetical protein